MSLRTLTEYTKPEFEDAMTALISGIFMLKEASVNPLSSDHYRALYAKRAGLLEQMQFAVLAERQRAGLL